MTDDAQHSSPRRATQRSVIGQPSPDWTSVQEDLAAQLRGISVPEAERREVRKQHFMNLASKFVAGLVPKGQLVNEAINYNKEVEARLEQKKLRYLINIYIQKTNATEQAFSELCDFLDDDYGSALCKKLKDITSSSAPDEEQIIHLGSALKYIVESDFRRLFSLHKYALSQIEQMTPQALTMMADYKRWPVFYLPTPQMAGKRVVSDYVDEFALAYATKLAMQDKDEVERLKHCVSELSFRRYIEAYRSGEDHAVCRTTRIGSSILAYLAVPPA